MKRFLPQRPLARSTLLFTERHRSYSKTSAFDRPTDRLLVVGSGVAGSTAALVAAETYKIPVTLLCAGSAPTNCNSYWAQGGIIYQGDPAVDSPDLLANDIHRAGAGLCHGPAVRKVAEEGPDRVRQLLLNSTNETAFCNVPFDRETDGELSVCLEASHAAPRILHTADHTGKTITEHMAEALERHPLITVQPNTIVTDLILSEEDSNSSTTDGVCIGAATLSGPEYARYGTVLAAGGLAGLYQHTTNPSGFNALGSAVAIALRAGLPVSDLEYVQFHPTALHIPGQPRFLLTEALRGEGAILRTANGRAFCKDYTEMGELAPRDIVARAVFMESIKSGQVFLDITHRDREWLYQRFPTIHRYLQTNTKLDMARDPMPVIPAAHYTCGGVLTDLDGATPLANCYAAGEAARTGLHGGNRLASTSLLEGLVFGAAVADHVGRGHAHHEAAGHAIAEALPATGSAAAHGSSSSNQYRADVGTVPAPQQQRLDPSQAVLRDVRRILWDGVGVCRNERGLLAAVSALEECQESAAHYHNMAPSTATAAARDASTTGLAVAQAALSNPQSAGAHYVYEEEEEDEEVLVAASR